MAGWLLFIVIACLLAGVALAAIGLRGRRVDDHRLCRRCGFDLSGTPDAVICNECGADLAARRAIRVGHRRRRGRVLAAGAALLAPALLVGGVMVWGWASGANWQRLKPAWWLVADLRDADLTDRRAAAVELSRRHGDDDLSESTVDSAIAAILDWQNDRALAWDPAAGVFVEQARLDGKVGDDAWTRYARQGFSLSLAVRPVIRQGEPLPVRIERDLRLGGPSLTWVLYAEQAEFSVGPYREGERARESGDMYGGLTGGIRVSGTTSASTLAGYDQVAGFTASLPPGKHRVRARLRAWVQEGDSSKFYSAPTEPPDTFLWSGELTLDDDLIVRPADAPADLFAPDDADVDAAMRTAVAVSAAMPSAYATPLELNVRLADSAPLPYLFSVEIQPAGGGEAVQFERGPSTMRDTLPDGTPAKVLDYLMVVDGQESALTTRASQPATRPSYPNGVDVVLRPSEAAVLRSTGGRPWGGTLVFRNVPVLDAATTDPPYFEPADE